MKTKLFILTGAIMIAVLSCKKDNLVKPKPEPIKTVQPEQKKPAVYNYQEAIKAKRSISN